MKTTTLTTCLLVLLAATLAAAAGPGIGELIAAAPAFADAGADAVVLYEGVDYGIDDAGRLTRRVRLVRKLYTHWAVDALSDVRLGWDSTRQDLEVLTSRTFMVDGSEVPTPANGFNEVTPYAVARAADFLGMREMVVSLVGTEPGCVTELVYVLRDREPGALPAGGREFLAGDFPILAKDVRLAAPGGFRAAAANADALTAPLLTESADGERDRTWSVRDVPAMPADGGAPDPAAWRPCLVFSAASGWEDVATRLKEAGAAPLGDEPRRWLDRLPPFDDQDADLTGTDIVQRVAALVGSRLATVDTPQPWGRAPRHPDRVFASSCGTAWEKALLARALLEAAGLAPELGFFSPGHAFLEDAATPAAFTDLRVVVQADGENWWLDPGSDRAIAGRCDLVGATGLILEDQGLGFRTYVVKAAPGRCELRVNIEPGDDPALMAADIDLQASGALWRRDPGDDAETVARAIADSFLEEAELGDVEVVAWTRETAHLRFTATGTLPAEGDDLLRLDLPSGPRTPRDVLPGGMNLVARERRSPLILDADLESVLRLDLTLPAGLVLDHAPAALDAAGGGHAFSLAVAARPDGVSLTRTLRLAAGTVAANAYPDLSAVLAAAARPADRALALRRE